ncbi:MAG TPA: family 16 glycoside hydrolase [Anaerolineales bacterium]|nr:family 16 glycoside hydrolase [Anaerolineales bacterium]
MLGLNKHLQISPLLLLAAFLLIACQPAPAAAEPTVDLTAVYSQVAATLAAEQSAAPSLTATQESQAAGVIFEDDFADVMSGWEIRNESTAVTDYLDGVFVIQVNIADTSLWSKPHGSFENVHISVDALQTAGPAKNLFGIICRYQDSDNFYRFVIGADGFAGITKRSNGEVIVISAALLTVSPAVNQGFAANHIEAFCAGPNLALWVNGQQVAEAVDEEFSSGEIGLIASSGAEAGIEIHFDNFVVSGP